MVYKVQDHAIILLNENGQIGNWNAGADIVTHPIEGTGDQHSTYLTEKQCTEIYAYFPVRWRRIAVKEEKK